MRRVPIFAIVILAVVVIRASSLFSPTNMTSQTAPSPFVATASSAFPDDPCPALPTPCGSGGFTPFGPFRETIGGGGWTGMHNGVDFLKLDIGAGNLQVLASYDIQGGTVGRMPKDWTMQGSVNDSTYFTLDTRTGITTWVTNVVKSFTVNGGNTNGFRYFKLAVTANNNAGQFTEVNNMELFGDPPSTGVKHRVISQ